VIVTFFFILQPVFGAELLPMWDKSSYQIGEWATIMLQDTAKNFNHGVKDTIYITVESDSFKDGVQLKLIETENQSGVFSGKIRLSSEIVSNDSILAKEGDSVHAIYGGYVRSAKVEQRNILEISPVLVSTNKDDYKPGETITISGKLSYGNPSKPVSLSVIDPNGRIILQTLIKPSYNLRFYHEIKTDNSLLKDSGNYKIQVWHESESRKAETVFSFSTSYDLEPKTKSVKIFGTQLNIEYSITSGKVSLLKPTDDSLQFSIDSNSGGHFTVELPRNLIDAKTTSGVDYDFLVLVQGRKAIYVEKSNQNERTLTIPYTYRTKSIEIKGTFLEINPIISSPKSAVIPDWIRNNAEWWSKGLIKEGDFLFGIQYLVNQGIIVMPKPVVTLQTTLPFTPNWIKDIAGWWSSGQISDDDFATGLTYLIEHGIIRI